MCINWNKATIKYKKEKLKLISFSCQHFSFFIYIEVF